MVVNTTSMGKEDVKARSFWENNATSEFQHIDRQFVTNKIFGEWKKWLTRFTWFDKRVLDYGIGGGYLGELLLKRMRIAAYIGIDISKKSLVAAAKNLGSWANNNRVTLRLVPQQFADFHPDI